MRQGFILIKRSLDVDRPFMETHEAVRLLPVYPLSSLGHGFYPCSSRCLRDLKPSYQNSRQLDRGSNKESVAPPFKRLLICNLVNCPHLATRGAGKYSI